MEQPNIDIEKMVKAWETYLTPALAGYEKGFLQETGALPHEWCLVERQRGQGWVYGLTSPQNFWEYLEMLTPDDL